MQELDIKIL